MWETITSGEFTDLAKLRDYEDSLAEGQRGRLSFNLRTSVPSSIIQELQSKLDNAGVLEAKVSGSGNNLDIQFRKGFPWLVVIVAAVLGLIVLAILIVSWQLFKEVPEEAQGVIAVVVVMAIIITVIVVAFLIFKGKVPRITRGGK